MIQRARRAGPILALMFVFGACRSAAPPASASGATSLSAGSAPGAIPATPSIPVERAEAATGAAAPRAAVETDAVSAGRASLPDFGAPGWTRIVSESGARIVCWRPVAESVPRNRNFDLEAWVFEDGEARPGMDLTVTAWMPDHSHGMLHAPRTQDRGDGSYLVQGMLLHMRGHWDLQFNLVEGASSDMARCSLEVK